MPQNEPGNLYLYDRRSTPDTPVDGAAEPVAIFPGHGNYKVKEFLWRTRGEVTKDGLDMREFQLVSWGNDNELRLQKPDPSFLKAVGFERGRPARKNLNITRQGAVYKTFRTVDDSVHRDRRSATMSDPRPGSGGQHYRRSAFTVGMHAPHRRVGPAWRGTSMKAKLPAGKDVDRSQAQIGWMRGISLAKRKAGAETGMRKDSGVFSPNYDDQEWGEPETVQEEFVRISNQLPNVKWENIDMDSLTLNASLKGPWGVDNETIFIKVKVDIPTNYPQGKAPKFFVEKTLLMPDETHKRIEQEVNQIAGQFLKRKENCLGVAFTYLLGEVDLETSTTLFKNVRDLDDDIDGLADESSSEEDDDAGIPAGGSASMSQELAASTELDPTNTLAQTQRPTIPPLPRFCGARFSNDGRLVCFFPTRDERARGLFSVAGTTDSGRDRQKDEPNFAGFGRLAQDSPPPKQRYDEASATDDQSGSDESETSTSSSDSEPTAMSKISMWYQPGRRFRKTWSANESIRSSGGGTGAGTGTGTGTSRKRAGKPKNILSIYDFRDMLPSKKQFAEEYAIFGDGADVCEHNAQVAQKYGYPDLVDIWKYAALLLRTGIPLELHEQRNHRESVLVIAKDLASHLHDGDDPMTLVGRVKWGHHPLAQGFVNDLFEYFEEIGDIQMLAMLSCIFGETSAEDSVAIAESHLTQPETPLPMKAPSFSLEYFPTDPSLWNINYKSQASSAITTPRTAHTPAAYSDAEGSPDLAAWFGEPTSNSYSCGETPPKSSRDHLQERDSTQSLSTSPENRVNRRSNSAVSGGFAASLPRTLANMVSGSPPDPPLRKKPSPAETMLGNFAPSNITWGASTVFGASTAPSTEPPTARTSVSDDDHRRGEILFMIPVGVNCIPENQGLFDDDGWMSTPLLSPLRNQLYASYRYAYAELLFMWGQRLSRLEIMKFDVLRQDSAAVSSIYDGGSYHGSFHEDGASQPDDAAATIPFSSRREQLQSILASGRGLDVTGLCCVHETQLDPIEYASASAHRVGGAVGTCARCPRGRGPQTQLRCVYCAEPIHALYAACLGCGCASHADCLAEWHAQGETECPAGDECQCLEEASHGQVESWTALRAAVALAEAQRRLADSTNPPPPTSALRQRRTSVPARLFGFDDDGGEDSASSRRRKLGRAASLYGKEEEDDDNDDDDERDRDEGVESQDWESVGSSSKGIPSAGMMSSATTTAASLLAGGKPPPHGDELVSAARLSLGNRLKKSLGEGRPAALRRKSGGVAGWKR